MPFKLPKGGKLSSDIDDRRDEVQDPANERSRTITNLDQEVARYRSLGTHRTISNKDYMKNLSTATARIQQEGMHDKAMSEMADQAKRERQKKTASKFKGVK